MHKGVLFALLAPALCGASTHMISPGMNKHRIAMRIGTTSSRTSMLITRIFITGTRMND